MATKCGLQKPRVCHPYLRRRRKNHPMKCCVIIPTTPSCRTSPPLTASFDENSAVPTMLVVVRSMFIAPTNQERGTVSAVGTSPHVYQASVFLDANGFLYRIRCAAQTAYGVKRSCNTTLHSGLILPIFRGGLAVHAM